MRVFDLFNKEDRDFLNPITKDVNENLMPEAEIINPEDHVTMDIPLLLRIMEYAREDAKTDMDLHTVTERMIELSQGGQKLTMSNYNDIVGSSAMEGDAPAEKLIKDVEYRPEETDDEEDVHEGYGRYWCSTDKRWKERKGPKQSRG